MKQNRMNGSSMSQKAAMLAQIEKINEVPGFDPAPFVVDYADLNTGEVRKRLPVMIQMAWFRMKYPEGRISVQVSAAKDCFVATARVYPYYKDPADCYLAEATASRGLCEDKPSVSPREWAQTAAVGIALRNAGFGLQFAMAGEDFENVAPDELGLAKALPEMGQGRLSQSGKQPEQDTLSGTDALPEMAVLPGMETLSGTGTLPGMGTLPGRENLSGMETRAGQIAAFQPEEDTAAQMPVRELTEEEKLQKALQTPCPIVKFSGKSLGEVLRLDPGAIKWVATKFSGDEEVRAAARRICEYALQSATA